MNTDLHVDHDTYACKESTMHNQMCLIAVAIAQDYAKQSRLSGKQSGLSSCRINS